MKPFVAILMVLIVMTAFARAAAPLDPSRRAEANDKVVSPGTVNQPCLSFPTPNLTVAPQSSKSVESKMLSHKTIDAKRVNQPTTERPLLSKPNVETPRASVSDQDADRSVVVPTVVAPIPARRIEPDSAAGEQELREQLNQRP